MFVLFFFLKQKTAYEMRISDWSSDVCSSDLHGVRRRRNAMIDKSISQRFAAGQPAAGPADAKGGLDQCSRPLPAVTMLRLRLPRVAFMPAGGRLSHLTLARRARRARREDRRRWQPHIAAALHVGKIGRAHV